MRTELTLQVDGGLRQSGPGVVVARGGGGKRWWWQVGTCRAPQVMGQWTPGESVDNLQLHCFSSVILTLFCQPQAFSSFLNFTTLRKIREEPVTTFVTKVGQEKVIFLLIPSLKSVQEGLVVPEPTARASDWP